MKKIISLIIILCCFSYNLKADPDTKAFQLTTPPDLVVDNSLYNKFEFIDSRSFNDYLGFVQTSIFNFVTAVIEEPSLEKQLNSVFQQITTQNAQKGTLVFQLRRLYFSEITKNTSETGYCHIRYNLYEKKDNRYYFISMLDTLVTVKAMDVTGKLLSKASNTIVSHIANNLTQQADPKRSYSMVDVLNINYFEKGDLKLYGITQLKDGLYKDFKTFANQTPKEYKIEPYFEDSLLVSFKATDIKTNKQIKFKADDVYALVINGQAYVSNYKCYVPIFKKDGEYQFINKGTIRNSTFFHTVGIQNPDKKFNLGKYLTAPVTLDKNRIVDHPITMTIDHLNGEYIPTPENASFYYYFK
ncbi:hypothetical protein CLV62_101500 [Dysgonomonas alginatilytica]|uniref:Uncharacterized protein n=1 Tax=Dysgonomonas alginatilytica TaxID=1605892 RepID=A0A2V3PWJ9_9BACT|nr:hypothetical protein [Dysgonomonas alginatilytica]PXV69231.1 hypothetical protein CLV62_101500 [Dysgonomonas alginatilytica]